MPLKICHFSDWHGEWSELPEADLYICTGDMLPNFWVKVRQEEATTQRGLMHGYEIHKDVEIFNQAKFIRNFDARQYLGTKDAPVVVVRGNHDFVDLAGLFGGKVYEIGRSVTTFDKGVIPGINFKIGGFRGINDIGDSWSDELSKVDLDTLSKNLPADLDILVTHAPPHGLLDTAPKFDGIGSEHCGIEGLGSLITKQLYSELKLKLHCFGHIHECFGLRGLPCEETKGFAYFSNGAMGYLVWEQMGAIFKPIEVKKCIRRR